MKKVTTNCEVLLKFVDGKGHYVVRNPGCGTRFNTVLTTSLLGQAIYGKKEGEIVEFFNSAGELTRVKIQKIFDHQLVYSG